MKKIRSKLSLVLLLILSFVVMLGAAASMLVRADAKTNGEPAVVEVYSDDWYEITITENSLTILLDAQIGSYKSISRDDLTNIKNAAVKAIRTLVINKLLEQGDVSPVSALASVALNEAMPVDDSGLEDMSKRYKDYLTNRLKMTTVMGGQEQAIELAKFLDGQYDMLIEYAATSYIADHPDVDLETLTSKVHDEVAGVIKEVLEYLSDKGNVYVGNDLITEDLEDDIYDATMGKLIEISKQVYENKGEMSSVDIARLLEMIYGVKIGDYQVYNGDKFVLSEIRKLISSLPKPSEIANWADDEMNISYDISVETTLGNVDFNLTVGLKGDASNIRNAAQYIADHFTAYNNNGVYTVEVIAPDELSAVLLKLSNTSRIPDDVKHAVFSLFNKTGDEIFDKASGYSYQQIMDYLKSIDFQGLFAGMLDAQKIKDYFGGFGVDLTNLTDEKLDEVINTILQYAEKIANKKDVEGLEDFLKSLGVPVGIPSQLEGAVQKFLNLLNKIDYKYWNATTIREFINDNGRFNAKVDELLTRLANSAKAEKIYNAFVDVAETVFDYLPDQIHNKTILDFYRGDGELSWAGNFNYDVKGVITKIVEKLVPYAEEAGFENAEEYVQYIEDFINSYFEGDLIFNVDLSLKLNLTDIYKVEYIVKDEVIGAGLLPVGADVVFYANKTEVDGLKIIAWVDEEGTKYEKMPAEDIKLYAVTEFEAYITVDGEEVEETTKVYDGEPVVLTVEFIGAPGANPTFTWYKDGEVYAEIIGMDGATLELVNVADSGVYYCVVTNGDFEFLTATTQEVTVVITKAPIDPTVTLEGWTYGAEANEPEVTGNLGNGEVTYIYEGIDGTEYGPSADKPVNAGTYKLTITVEETDNYLGGEAECEFTIDQAELTVKVTSLSKVYNGKEQKPTITITGVNGERFGTTEYTVKYYIDGKEVKAKNVGVYIVVITLNDTEKASNYKSIDTTYTFKITEAELTVKIDPPINVYNGKEQKPTITVTGVNKETLGADDYTVQYLLNGKAPEEVKNVGVYTIIIKLNKTEKANNYKAITGTYTYEIVIAELELPESLASVVYNGEEQVAAELETIEGVNGDILVNGIDYFVTYNGNEAAKNAGSYTVAITLADSELANKYELPEYSLTFVIEKATLTVVVNPDEGEYNNAAHEPEVTVIGVNDEALGEEEYTVSYYFNDSKVEEIKNVGEYSIAVALNGLAADNYEVPENGTYIVVKAELDFSGYWIPDPANYTYDGTEKSVEFKFLNEFEIPEDVEFSVVGNTGEDAGEYYAYIVVIYDDNNYDVIYPEIGSDEENAYVWEIKQATLNINDYAKFADDIITEFTFDGKEHVIDYQLIKALPAQTQLEPTGVWSEINAGKYTATLTITTTNPNCTVDEDNYYITLTWEIESAVIDLSAHGASWDYTSPFPFDGSTYTVKLFNEEIFDEFELVTGYKFSYVDNENSEVGTYSAKVVIVDASGKLTENYTVVIVPCEWAIVSGITLDFSGYKWTSHAGFIYEKDTEYSVVLLDADGNELDLTALGLYEGYTLKYFDNTATNAGIYKAYIAVVKNGEISNSYIISGLEDGTVDNTHEWEIAKAQVEFIKAPELTETSIVYDGKEHKVEVVYEVNPANAFECKTSGTFSATNVGTYYVTVVLTLKDSANYYYDGQTEFTLNWEITKAKVTLVKAPELSETGIVYDGEEHTVEVVYEVNPANAFECKTSGTFSATNVGTYYVTVVLELKDSANYDYDGETVFELEWTIEQYDVGMALAYLSFEHNGEAIDRSALVYDGDEYIAIVSVIPENYFNVTVNGMLKATNAGTYYVTVVIELKDTYNCKYDGQTEFVLSWEITPAPLYDIMGTWMPVGYDWNEGAEYTLTFSGSAHVVEFIPSEQLPENVVYYYEGTRSATDVGTYTVEFKVISKDGNYGVKDSAVTTLTWKIVAKEIDLTGVKWDNTALTFDGSEQIVTLVNLPELGLVDGYKLEYYGNKATNAGTYYAHVAIVTTEGKITLNYVIVNLTEGFDAANTYEWSIAKKEITVTGSWNGAAAVEFDGKSHEVTFDAGEYKDYVTVSYVGGNTAIDAGNYVAVARLMLKDANNYSLSNEAFTYNWSITAKVIDISEYDWNGVSFEYSADGVEIKLVDKDGTELDLTAYGLANGYELQYRGTKQTKVGSYVAELVIVDANGETGNYVLVGNTHTAWSIVKKVITVATSWSTTTEFKYDGKSHEVTLNVTGEYADYVTVNVSGNAATAAGNYVAVAELKLKAEYVGNYELSKSVYTLSWKIVSTETPNQPQPPVQENTTLVAEGGDLPEGVKVTVTASESLPEDCSLTVTATPNEYKDDDFKPFVADGMRPSIVRVYAISIENLPENFGGEFTVTISNSEFAGKDLIVVHVPLDEEGKPVDKEMWSNTDATLAGKNLTFGTPGFSDFAVVEQIRVNDSNSLWLMWLMLIIIIILLVLVIILLIKLLRNNGEPEKVDDEIQHPVVIIKTVEKAEEENQEEAIAVEETVVEEEPVIEEEPAAEEESDVEMDIDAQSIALLTEDASEEATESVVAEPLIAADGSRIIYDRSFTARLIQSDITLKDYYTELKNYILSYNGVKSRISWHFDSFNMGREKCAKIQFRGKSMYVYLPLSIAEVPEKYNVKDVSDMTRYEEVPTMFKVRKPRSIKHAKELIDMVMQKLGVEQGDIPNVKYRPRYRSTKSLIDMGLIKVKTSNSTFIASKTNND